MFIRDLRRLLARSSLSALQPDLIILDEFQRFKYLLDEDNEFALLAQELFNYRDHTGRPAKVLLLSATPYKMYTLQDEDENHYEDFLRTVRFLLNGRAEGIEGLRSHIDAYRKIFLQWKGDPSDHDTLSNTKESIETILRQVMVRTERLAASPDRNGMLSESWTSQNNLHPDDLVAFAHFDHLAQYLGVENQVEYWKSASYPLNLMEAYKLKRQFKNAIPEAATNGLFALVEQSDNHLLHWNEIQKYQKIDPGNARLRTLISQTIESGNWKLLWVPANLPYYLPEGPYADTPESGFTKSLVFSSWQIVPKMIALLLSYEAERKVMETEERKFSYDELLRKRPPLLKFSRGRGRLTGLSNFTLMYPCLTLAREFDPLTLAMQTEDGSLSSSFFMLQRIKLRLRSLLEKATKSIAIVDTGQVDESWYWYAPVILDTCFYRKELEEWLISSDKPLSWEYMLKAGSEEDDESAFLEHVQDVMLVFDEIPKLGRQPKDLLDMLAKITLASPAVTSLRSILRVTGASCATPEFLAAAAQAGLGFRSLFNQSDTIALLQFLYKDLPERGGVYWRTILDYCLQGNLQAVLDEYVHILHESLGLVDHDASEAAVKFGQTMRQALSLRSPNLRFDEIRLETNPKSVTLDEHSIRCRYALRFGRDKAAAMDDRSRDTDVRVAFNSPFRPFVLATTSVGQEGLDFHQYCHKVVHWNLPPNPVDLEQREGRVHRYKGHVIRRNLAHAYSLSSLKAFSSRAMDPWRKLFELACENREAISDLEPYWIFDRGPYRIERTIPVLPLSREIDRMKELRNALVAYRAVIGQPRQQELMDTLRLRMTEADLTKIASQYSINLSPPSSKEIADRSKDPIYQ